MRTQLDASLKAWSSGHMLLLPSPAGKAFTPNRLTVFMSRVRLARQGIAAI